MPRPVRRAAVLGTTAHVARKRGEAQGAAAAAQALIPEQPPPPAAEAPEAAPTEDRYGNLMKLKELLDAGALTQAEFDAEKQKILGS